MHKQPLSLTGMILFALFNLSTLFLTLPAQANLDQLFGTKSQNFLPVEEAFQFSGSVNNDTAAIHIQVTPEHYLYKHQFQFKPVSNISSLGQPIYPASESIFDPYYNKNLDIFSSDFTIRLPVKHSGNLPELHIRFQGCAKAGLCYPPHDVIIPLVVENAVLNANRVADQQNILSNSALSKNSLASASTSDGAYFQQFSDHSLPVVLLLFLLAGIGLSLTPCVLPMFPILSSLILGNQAQSTGRTVALTTTYILTMSVTFAAAGTLMGLFGAGLNLQAKLQSPWLLVPMAVLFVLLALSMFGLYELQLPARVRDKLSGQQQSGSFSGTAIMGVLSALVVSPCVSAPLAGALIYISTTGDAVLGALTLFTLGLGMGIPLYALALGGRHWLPTSGSWMNGVRSFFGVLLLGVAIWMLERIIPSAMTLLLWGALLIGSGIFLGALNHNTENQAQKLRQVVGILSLIYGTCLVIGAAMGNNDPLKPLANNSGVFQTTDSGESFGSVNASNFIKVNTLQALSEQLAEAKKRQQPALVDLYADWCISCKVMERTVFPDPRLTDQLQQLTLIKLDITDNTREHQQFLNENQLFGPPAMLFFDQFGQSVPALQSQGEVTVEQLHQKLTALLTDKR